jgi:ubiquinone/menaquinone biosynthesis C-methylase UbiE
MVLDLACGRGFFSGRLRHNLGSSARVIGLDLSETILRVARAEQKGIPFVLGDTYIYAFTNHSWTHWSFLRWRKKS